MARNRTSGVTRVDLLTNADVRAYRVVRNCPRIVRHQARLCVWNGNWGNG